MKKTKRIDACIQGCYTTFNSGNEGVAFLCRNLKIFLEEGETYYDSEEKFAG